MRVRFGATILQVVAYPLLRDDFLFAESIGLDNAWVIHDKGPILSTNRASKMSAGTAYRIPGETSHVSQPRSRSTSKRRMRHMRRDP